MTAAAWWLEEGLTTAEQVAEAAQERGVLRGRLEGDVLGAARVPMVLVEAHGGPWLIYPDPLSVLGWVAEQVEPLQPGEVDPISVVDQDGEALVGWLGAGDLEAGRVVGNLLDANELPVDLHLREPFIKTRHLRAPAPPAAVDAGDVADLVTQIRRDAPDGGHHLWLARFVESSERLYPDPADLAREIRTVAAAYRLVDAEQSAGAHGEALAVQDQVRVTRADDHMVGKVGQIKGVGAHPRLKWVVDLGAAGVYAYAEDELERIGGEVR